MKRLALCILLVLAVLSLAAPSLAAGGRKVRGTISWYNTNSHGAATHQGDGIPCFKQGAVLKITYRGKSTWVKVNDMNESPRLLDVDPDTFERLGVDPSVGLITATVQCGRGGNLPMKVCHA